MIRLVAAGSSLLIATLLLIGREGERGIHLVFADVASLVLILALALGTIAWMAYISWSQRRMRQDMQNLVTYKDLDERLETLRQAIRGRSGDGDGTPG